MLSEQDIELAHPDAFDFVFGTLGAAKSVWFNSHLDGCRPCQKVVAEYRDIGQIIQNLPPHVEPPADLEDRTVAAMAAAQADRRAKPDRRSHHDAGVFPTLPGTDRRSGDEDRAVTRVYPVSQPQPPAEAKPDRPSGDQDQAVTRVYPVPQPQPPAEPEARALVTRLPAWGRHPRRLAAGLAVAAAIIVAAVVVLPHGGGPTTPARAVVVIPLHATTEAKLSGVGAATGRATARQAGESWTYVLTVHGLKVLPGDQVYACWYAASGSTRAHPVVVSGGTFVVGNSGSTTVTMTSGVDPRDFRTMEITAEYPGNGAMHGTVLLTGQTL